MPDTSPAVEELELLRTTNADLLKKSRDRKAKVTEHETTIADLTARLTTAETALHEATVGTPLRAMAVTVSPVPELWLAEFAKHYKVEMKDGKLQVLDTDGKPAMDGEQPVEFTAPAIIKLLTASDDEALSSFAYITRGSLAAGGGASQQNRGIGIPGSDKPTGKPPEQPQFGLR